MLSGFVGEDCEQNHLPYLNIRFSVPLKPLIFLLHIN
jgi:hypothetical protein